VADGTVFSRRMGTRSLSGEREPSVAFFVTRATGAYEAVVYSRGPVASGILAREKRLIERVRDQGSVDILCLWI
jgi:hypothetical protein